MIEPYLSLYINEDTLYISKKLPTEAKPRVILDLGINEIVSDDFDEAARKLGTTVLGILCLWHKDALKEWGVHIDKDDARVSDFELAMDLIGRSVSGRTSTHVKSIELFLRQAAISADSVQQFFTEAWPPIRAQLELYPTRA